METLERSRVCRLCGIQAGMTINIFGKCGNHVKKINMILPILVHEMDLLPKHLCHPCNYKLQEFHRFYEDCRKTDTHLKNQLSWMQGSDVREEIIFPMVQINNVKIKTEPLDEEQEITATILNEEKITNFEKNHYTKFHEKYVQFSGLQCPKCGYYCSNNNNNNNNKNNNNNDNNSNNNNNNNYRSDDIPKNASKTRPKNRSIAKQNYVKYLSKDSIKRNLFATEIFDNKNSKAQTEIPICDISREFFNEKEANEIYSITRLNRLSDQPNGTDVIPKIEISNISSKIPSRTLRPKKKLITTFVKSRSSSDKLKNSKSKIISEKITQENKSDSDNSAFIEIKLEALDNFERNLRPRSETIDYSETKRKNPLAWVRNCDGRLKKIKMLPDYLEDGKFGKENNKDLRGYVKKIKVERTVSSASMILAVKPGRDNFTRRAKLDSKISKMNRDIKNPFKLKTNTGKFSKVNIKEEIMDGIITSKINSKTNLQMLSRSIVGVERFNDKMVDQSKRKFHKNYRNTALCLRSHTGYARNDNLKKFESMINKPMTRRYKNGSQWFSFDSIKYKGSRVSNKTSSTTLKYQDCNICKKHFASQELYRLHGCYASKRH